MEMTGKLHPGTLFAPETFRRVDGPDYVFGMPGKWQALFLFRGRHCPICMGYLGKIETKREAFSQLGIAIAAVSADSESQARDTAQLSNVSFPLLYGMGLATMRRLGLYISDPRSEQETDHTFSEPGLLVTNANGILQLVEISNAPFLRSEVDVVLQGLRFLLERDYPIRGTRW